MSANVPNRLPVNTGLIQFLLDNAGFPIGDHEPPTLPDDDKISSQPPFAVLYGVMGGGFWGPEWHTAEDSADFRYQVTAVGLSPAQAQWVADKIRIILIGRTDDGDYVYPFVIPGIDMLQRMHDGPPGGPTDQGNIWNVVDTYLVRVSLS